MTGRIRTELQHTMHPRSTFRVITTPGPADSEFPPFVLVHGVGTSHRYLSRLHQALAVKAGVVSVDLPGFGGVSKPPTDLDVSQMAAALADICASSSGAAVIVGHSMGAQWALELALQRPDLVSSVVMIGPVADDKHRTILAQSGALALDALRESPLLNSIVLRDYLRCGVSWYLTQTRHMLTYPIEERVGRLTRPLLIIRGDRDPVAGRGWCRKLSRLAAISSLVEIPGHGHAAQHSAPRAVSSAILHHVAAGGRS